MRLSRFALVLPAIATALLLTAPAGALDSSKPAADCTGPFVTDKPGDTVDQLGATVDNLDITSVFFKDDPSKGAEAVTANIVVKNLTTDVPLGNTGIAWIVYYDVNGATYYVRAIHDVSGATAFEHGSIIDVGGLTSLSPRDSDTPGKMFEGADGVVQLVVPAADAKAGTQLKNVYVETREVIQLVPSNVPTPTRGLSSLVDRAPEAGGKAYTVSAAACAAAPPAGGPGGGAAVKLKLTTKSVAASKAKKGKALSLKLSSSGKVTNLKGTLKKGKSSVGSGKLASLDGTGTLKVKLTKNLKKGSYTLALKGNDSAGKKVAAKATLSVR